MSSFLRLVGLNGLFLCASLVGQQKAATQSKPTAIDLEERRVAAEEEKVQIDRETLTAKQRSDWVTGIAALVPLIAIAFGVYQINRSLRGQAQMKVLDFADSGYDDEDILRRARLACEVLKRELPSQFSSELETRKPERRHLPFPVVEHRSGLIQMLIDATPDNRTLIIRYWNACFNDFKTDSPNHWFSRIAQEAGVDLQTLTDFNMSPNAKPPS